MYKESHDALPFVSLWGFFLVAFSGFAELQTDMTDLTKELNRSQGIPFLEYKQFVTRTFFPKVRNSIFSRCYLISTGRLTIPFFSLGFLIFLPHMSLFTFVTGCNMQGKKKIHLGTFKHTHPVKCSSAWHPAGQLMCSL